MSMEAVLLEFFKSLTPAATTIILMVLGIVSYKQQNRIEKMELTMLPRAEFETKIADAIDRMAKSVGEVHEKLDIMDERLWQEARRNEDKRHEIVSNKE